MRQRPLGLAVLAVVALSFLMALVASADAATQKRRRAPAPNVPKDAALILDGTSGRVLYERNADALRHPASLTKMMTLYLLFEALEEGTLTLQSEMKVSAWAASQSPTKIDVRAGQTIDVDTAIRAIVIRSANDVAVVIGEALGGTEAAFATMMDAKARDLGMWHTNFENASGLPDVRQVTTARDMAMLGRRIAYDFPKHFTYFALRDFTYRGRRYETHDNLLKLFPGTDGIKTGYTRMSGFNLVTSAVRNNKHLVGVLMGGTSAYGRDLEMMRLLGIGFGEAEKNPLLVAEARVPWLTTEGDTTAPNWSEAPPPKIELAAFEPAKKTTAPVRVAEAPKAAAPTPKPLAMASLAPTDVILPLAKPLLEALGESLPIPALRPAEAGRPAEVLEQGDIGGTAVDVGHAGKQWVVQVGAYATRALALAELSKFAQRSLDVLGQAKQLVMPVTGADGHTVFRARFGLFAEDEARAVCRKMAQRGANCFAAQAS